MTKSKEKYILTDAQRVAIQSLAAGANHTQAAAAAGCERHSVGRWMQDPAFIAALNAQRAAAQCENADRLRNMAAAALDVVQEALESDDQRIALSAAQYVLKAVGLDSITAIRPEDTDPKYVDEKIKQQQLGVTLAILREMGPLEPSNNTIEQ